MTSRLIVMPNVGKRAVEALAIALVYIGTAQPGFLIAIAPGNVTVVWPPSGIALAAMLLLGYRAGAGVWLGSFLVNLLFFIFHDVLVATAIITAGSIATGSMLQAFLAAFLYRRMIGAQIPPGLTAVLKFMTIAALSCLVAATVGVSSLAFSSAIVRTSITDAWLTWWVGDLVGILTIAPVLLVVGYRARQGEGIRYLTFPLISGVTGLALFAGYNIWNLGDHAVAAYLGVSPAWLYWAVFVIGLLLRPCWRLISNTTWGLKQHCVRVNGAPAVSSWNWRHSTAPLRSGLPCWTAISAFYGSITS